MYAEKKSEKRATCVPLVSPGLLISSCVVQVRG